MRRHFDNGVKLYHDGNYPGALAEFEAAYGTLPSAGSLRNVALCQKALFRYSEAVDTLEQLLQKHSAQLDAGEQQAVKDAMAELSALVGSLVIRTIPADAALSVNGRALTREEREHGIRLNVGEHTISASAPGYASTSRVLRVAGGGDQNVHEVALKPTMGFLEIQVSDPKASISVDGRLVGVHRWRGPVLPGAREIEVLHETAEGTARVERRVLVKLGETTRVEAKLPAPTKEEIDLGEPASNEARRRPLFALPQLGWYALGSFSLLAGADEPRGFKLSSQPDGAEDNIGGGAVGARAGYRLWTPVAVEAMVEGGSFTRVLCVEETCKSDAPDQVKSQLYTFHVGGNLRLMSGGSKLRFTSTFGTGYVRHQLELEDNASDEFAGGTVTGWNPFFLLDVGAQLNFGHVLTEATISIFIDGASEKEKGYQPYTGMVFGGLGLRVGWSEWAPPRGSKLKPAGSARPP